ncbi:Cochaperone prefoldin complex subunit [Entomophthora muscae]|uniref:Cochaperone prefoldin complex subunit n=1 Tax=Entomophthora muscae TaxID=34485 RepID=A0ACC2T6A8_9FUNG|nr:Cochaperone prefoldin complex subunit [Entomophthora muscae]
MSSSKQKLSEQEILSQFNSYKQELTALSTKIGELESEAEEHKLVIDTMKPLDATRKCFRLIGGVLVERTVLEVLPALQTNADGIHNVMESLLKTYKQKDEEFKAFQKEHNVRIAPAPGS